MSETTTNQTEQAIQTQLQRLEWMIPDAKRKMHEAAQSMLRRAELAVKDSESLLADQPCSLTWVDFAEGDLRTAREARAELTKLYEQQNMLQFFLNKS